MHAWTNYAFAALGHIVGEPVLREVFVSNFVKGGVCNVKIDGVDLEVHSCHLYSSPNCVPNRLKLTDSHQLILEALSGSGIEGLPITDVVSKINRPIEDVKKLLFELEDNGFVRKSYDHKPITWVKLPPRIAITDSDLDHYERFDWVSDFFNEDGSRRIPSPQEIVGKGMMPVSYLDEFNADAPKSVRVFDLHCPRCDWTSTYSPPTEIRGEGCPCCHWPNDLPKNFNKKHLRNR